jgi:phosphoenolpyruvate carboxykinase (GTP)
MVPAPDGLTLDGLNISQETMEELLRVDSGDWLAETEQTGMFFEKFGSRFPEELRQEHMRLSQRLGAVAGAGR